MQALPLYYFPGTWLYVDDDKTLLGCMSLVFEENRARYKTFTCAKTCLNFLKTYESPLIDKKFLSSKKEDENYGMLQHTPVDFDVTKLSAIANDPNRYDEITAMVFDYHMPEMSGFDLLQNCDHFDAEKILLTGEAKDEEVIQGFSHRYMQRFLRKNEPNMEDQLVVILKKMTFEYFKKITQSLFQFLETENKTALSDPLFAEFFLNFCAQNDIQEYYLIDKQGSFLCIDSNRKRSYFVVHTDCSIDNFLKTYTADREFSPDFLEKIIARNRIPFFGLGKEAWNIDSTEWHNYFSKPSVLQGRVKYYWFFVDENKMYGFRRQ